MNKLNILKQYFAIFLFQSVKTLQKNQGQLYIVEKSLLEDKFSVIWIIWIPKSISLEVGSLWHFSFFKNSLNCRKTYWFLKILKTKKDFNIQLAPYNLVLNYKTEFFRPTFSKIVFFSLLCSELPAWSVI